MKYLKHPVLIAFLLGIILWGLNKSILSHNYIIVVVHSILAIIAGAYLWHRL